MADLVNALEPGAGEDPGLGWANCHEPCAPGLGGALLFNLLSRLCEHTSVMVTTNMTFAEWSGMFGDAKTMMALLGRLTHHCHLIETGNESYRFRHSTHEAKSRIKTWEQT